MKKAVLIFASAILCLSMAACSKGGDNTEAPHEHISTGEWDCDLETHWQVCECGQHMNSNVHNVEDDTCKGCGATFFEYDYDRDDMVKTVVTLYKSDSESYRRIGYSSEKIIVDDWRWDASTLTKVHLYLDVHGFVVENFIYIIFKKINYIIRMSTNPYFLKS